MKRISGVYKITNAVTGDFYIGSSKDIKRRLSRHKCPSSWNEQPNNHLYQDMQKYGVDKFIFQILAEVESECLKEAEQQFIEKLKPTYNNIRAKGLDIERIKKSRRKAKNKYNKKYNNQQCLYNGEILTFAALSKRFQRAGTKHPTIEAKKYLIL